MYWVQEDTCAGFKLTDKCPHRYEEMELITYTPKECREGNGNNCKHLTSYARFQLKYEKQQSASLQFYTTIFTCIVLTVASLTFGNDIELIVVNPIKKIVDIIQRLAEGPLKKPESVQNENPREKKQQQMNTKMLERTIFQISTLLQRGFGEKGAQIVSRALTYDERFVEWQIPGRKVNMIFSFCQIKEFSEINDCLRDEIIVFVNKIVQIIHECAKKWDGHPTNNYGDRYVLTWKLPTEADIKRDLDNARSETGSKIEEG